jgi:hypothetical protein
MRSDRCFKSNYLVSSALGRSTTVSEFAIGATRSAVLARLEELVQENALLDSIATETRLEIVRLRRLLSET